MSVLGTIASDLKKAGEAVEKFLVKGAQDAPAIIQDVVKTEEGLEPILNAFLPGSATAINLGNSLLDAAAQLIEDAGGDVSAGLAKLDLAPFVQDIQSVIAAAKALATKKTPAAA